MIDDIATAQVQGMDADSLEIRFLARGVAGMLALSAGVLVSTIRVPPLASPGESDALSVELVRTLDADMASARVLAEPERPEGADAAVVQANLTGEGQETRLWEIGPTGDLVFRNEERFRRCQQARRSGIDDADCPSANDMRRMVLKASARQA